MFVLIPSKKQFFKNYQTSKWEGPKFWTAVIKERKSTCIFKYTNLAMRAPYLLFKVSFLGPRVVPILYYAKRVEEEMCGNILTGMAVPCQSNIGKLINRNAFMHFLEYRYSKLFKHNAFKSTYIRYFQFQASMDTLLDRY